MKKILICTLLISLVSLSQLAFNGNEAHSNGSGAPASRTGSPGDGGNCSGCHTGSSVVTNQVLISSDIPASGYVPGTTYNIIASITKPGINKFGFQISPQNLSGQLRGTLINTTPSRTQLISSSKYITHTTGGTAATANSNTWNFQWTAPVAGTGAMTFYGAFVAANSSGSSSGDQVFLSTLPVQEDNSIGISEQVTKTKVKLFPVPCLNELYVETGIIESSEMRVMIFTMSGELIQQNDLVSDPLKKNIEVPTMNLPQGAYVITGKDKTGKILFHQKFIKA